MNKRKMNKVFESLKNGEAIKSLETLSCLAEARETFSSVANNKSGFAISSQVALFFKKEGFSVVKHGVGFKIF